MINVRSYSARLAKMPATILPVLVPVSMPSQGADEDAAFSEIIERPDDASQRTSEAIESHYHHHVVGSGVVMQFPQAGPVVAGAGHDVLEDAIHTGRVQRVELLVGGLVCRADAGVAELGHGGLLIRS